MATLPHGTIVLTKEADLKKIETSKRQRRPPRKKKRKTRVEKEDGNKGREKGKNNR